MLQILRSHVMVRIGGGWDTLENFLDRHDPCRCQSRGMQLLQPLFVNGNVVNLQQSRATGDTLTTVC